MTLADGKVVKIMTGRNLDRSAAKSRIYIVISDNGNQPVKQRQDYLFTNQLLVTAVLGMNRYGRITEHRFRTGGGNGNRSAAVF